MKLTSLLSLMFTCCLVIGQNVNIPDENFKALLLANTEINSNGDTIIDFPEATAFTGEINAYFKNIEDFTGIEAFTNLTSFNGSQNNMSSIDLSANKMLTTIYVSNCNALTSMNIANGNNSAIQTFYADVCPNLICVQVDDENYANTNWPASSGHIDNSNAYNADCGYCNVDIPDMYFKMCLLRTEGINTNGDNMIQCDEAASFDGTIPCNNQAIDDPTGLEAFTSITTLEIGANNLTSLDISSNTALTDLTCSSNDLTSLVVYENLESLIATNNQLSSVDLSNAPNLVFVYLNQNQLTNLDISNNPNIGTLYFPQNQVSSIDVSHLQDLNQLVCSHNNLTNLTFGTNQTSFWRLHADNNSFTSLDLSPCIALEDIRVPYNDLHTLNIANGNNQNVGTFYAGSNPNLTCIQVDDAVWSSENWIAPDNIDSTASFSEDCNASNGNSTSDLTIERINVYPNPSEGMVFIECTATIEMVEVFNMEGKLLLVERNSFLDLSSFPKGVYSISVQTNNGRFTQKIIR